MGAAVGAGGMVGSGSGVNLAVSTGTGVTSGVGDGPGVTGIRVGRTAPERGAGAATSVQAASRQTARP